jgi:hypothetical protein
MQTTTPTITLPVDARFTGNGDFNIKLGAVPTSLKLSGEVIGQGSAKVYYVTPDGRKLVFDSALSPTTSDGGRSFEHACIDTCNIIGSPDVTLQVELQNAALTINSLEYTTSRGQNTPPQWVGTIDSLIVSRNTPTSIDLSKMFVDSDGDQLGYIATDAPGLAVSISGAQITFTAAAPGTYKVTLIASDGRLVTRVPFTVQAQ